MQLILFTRLPNKFFKCIKYLSLFSLCCFANLADALSWTELWTTPDQQGAKALAKNQNEQAAKLFHNSNWQGVANYRAENYAEAAAAFAKHDAPENNYNRGNALVYQGKYQEAIAAYERCLQQNPQHADAKYN